MRQRGRVLVLVLGAVVGLAGCSGAPEGQASESTADVISPQPSWPVEPGTEDSGEPENEPPPTPEPLPLPEYPEDLELEDTAENALIAAEYFVELMNYAHSTGDVRPLEDVSAEVCEPCHAFVADIRNMYQAGGYVAGNLVTLESPVSSRSADGKAWEVEADWYLSDGVRVPAGVESTSLDNAVLPGHRIGVQLLDNDWIFLTFARSQK